MNRRTIIAVSLTIFLAVWSTCTIYAYGALPGNPSTVSRMALLLSLVKDSSVKIDHLAGFTIDKALVDGHYYSDKAPGQALLAYPAAFAVTALATAKGHSTGVIDLDRTTADRIGWTSHYRVVLAAAISSTSTLFTAVSAVAIFLLALRLESSYDAAVFSALTFGFSTPALGWGSVFFGHAVAGGALMLGFFLVVNATSPEVVSKRPGFQGLLAGVCLGIAVATEYIALPAAMLIVGMGLWRLSSDARGRLSFSAGLAAGGLPFVVTLAAYNYVAFGSFLQIGYSQVVGFDGMEGGFFGISTPKPAVLGEILIGPRRGLVWLAPTLVFLPLAWFFALRSWEKTVAVTAILVVLSYLAINAGYYYWDGGFSTGPRHIVPAIPFMCLALAALWDRVSKQFRWLLVGTSCLGALIAIVCASTTMAAYGDWQFPLINLTQRFLSGRRHGLLTSLGLPEAWSLLTQILIWMVALMVVISLGRQAPRERTFRLR